MKILVLGASGRAARSVINSLLFLDGIDRFYLADNNAEALCKLAADLGHLPVSPRYLDAEIEGSLHDRMAEADLVLGCLGPFHLHEADIVRAAIATGRDYISLCDDPYTVGEVLAMGAEAERAGVRILSGCGLTPGLSNLLACRAVASLQSVDSLELSWFLHLGSHLGMATLEHLMHSFSGKSPVLREGKSDKTRSGSWEEMVEFPPPIGWQAVSYMGHPEPVTLPIALGGIRDMWFKAGVGSKGVSLALHSLAWMAEGDKPELWQSALRAMASGLARRCGGSSLSAVRVAAEGAEGGVRQRRVLSVVGDYYRLSGLIMAAAVDNLVGTGLGPGVYTCEKALDNISVFAWMCRLGLRVLIGEEKPQEAAGAAGEVAP
jgi:hypothetical protein